MLAARIMFFPVGDGDCTLIKLRNGRTIVVDCRLKREEQTVDLRGEIGALAERDSCGRPFVDLFINTHPHKDHCRGFADLFFLGIPALYDDKRDKGKIIINELWASPLTLVYNRSRRTAPLRREVERRRDIYRQDPFYTGGYGSFLRLIGSDEDRRYCYLSGDTIQRVGERDLEWLKVGIMAPNRHNLQKAFHDGTTVNSSSMVLSFSFFKPVLVGNRPLLLRLIVAGDAEHDVWTDILTHDASIAASLSWDILLCPHHCSWSFFGDKDSCPHCPSPSSLRLLSLHRSPEAYIVASTMFSPSSFPPPRRQALRLFQSLLPNPSHFLLTSSTPNAPITFLLSSDATLIREV